MKTLLAAALMLTCGMSVQAQSLKDILSGVAEQVIGGATTTETSIVGTWTYDSPAVSLDSDNTLAKLGGTVASSKVESKLSSVYSKVGLDKLSITFDSDKNFTATVNKKTLKGTYTFDSSAKTLALKTSAGATVNASVTTTGSSMSLLFEADKLMTAIKTITSATSSLSSSASTINSLISNYSGMKLGFQLTKN